MIKEALLSYFSEQKDIILNNWLISKEKDNFKALHDLRVGIKKIKVLYQLIKTVSRSKFNFSDNFKEIRKLFKSVGLLRDLQVQKNLFLHLIKESSLNDYKKFIFHLDKHEESESNKLTHVLSTFNPKFLEDSFVDAALILEEISDKKVKRKILKQLSKRVKQIKLLMPYTKDNECMHNMRTRVKQTNYIIELLRMMHLDQKVLYDSKSFKKAADFLGLWHDYVILEEHITKFISENKSLEKKEKELFQSLIANISLEEKFLLEKAVLFLTRVKFNAF